MDLQFLSLFAGIGGLDLGLERAGMKCIGQVEINPFCRRVLSKHWPEVPKYEDVRTVTAADFRDVRVDLIAGGFPCQDISNQGLRAGIEGQRSGLWFQYVRLIREIRPRFVLVENVAALLSRGLDRVLGELAILGFDAEWSVLPACALGAPHPRERVFIVAYPKNHQGIHEPHSWEASQRLLNNPHSWQARPWDASRPRVRRMDDGLPLAVERIAALGNAVTPIAAEWIGRRIVEASKQ